MRCMYVGETYQIGQVVSYKKYYRTKGPTCILEVHVVAIQCVFQPVAHDFELHDLLADGHVWLCDVKLNFWVVDLIGQAITHHLWQIPDGRREGTREECIGSIIIIRAILYLFIYLF